MARFTTLRAFAATLVFTASVFLAPEAEAHSYLVQPKARDDFYHRNDNNTIGCPSPFKSTPTSYKAGETIDVRYWRNNHNGGFIRWALVPAGQPETKENFDKNVIAYTCRESGPLCTPKGKAARYKLDLDNALGEKAVSCGDKITLPDYLPAGNYVLQWHIYGSGWSYGNLGWAEFMWSSCADIRLTTAGTKPKPACPAFTGGDRVTKIENKGNDVCFYFWSNAVPNYWYKGDNAKADQGYKFDAPAEWKTCTAKSGGAAAGGAAANEDAVGKDDDNVAPAPSKAAAKPKPAMPSAPAKAPTPAAAPAPMTTKVPVPAPAPIKKCNRKM